LVERYVDWINVRLSAYDGFAMPENLEEAWEEGITVAGQVDRDAIRSAVEEIVGKNRYFDLSDTYSVAAWGAAGAEMTIVLQVSTAVGGAAGFTYLFKEILEAVRARGRHSVRQEPTSEEAAEWARSWLARSIGVPSESVRVVSVEPVAGGFRVGLEAKYGSFEIEQTKAGPSRLRRVSKPE
jgi:hypothetical protein